MLRSRFLWKLYAGYVVLILVSTATVGFLVAQQIERDALHETTELLRTRVTLLREAVRVSLEEGAALRLQPRLHSLGAEIHTRLTVLDSDGVVMADSEDDPARMENHSDRPEIQAAREDEIGSAVRFSHTLGRRMMYVAMPVRSGDRLVGFVRASLTLSAIDERLADLRWVVTLGASVAALVALILGFFMARGFAAPLTSMMAVAESMSEGDYGQELPVTRSDEVGKLALALNRMARSSQERMETITTDHNKLLAILAGMVEGVVAVDREECVVHMNAVAAQILRVSGEGAIGRKIWEVSRIPEVCEALSATLESGEGIRRELRLVIPPRDRVVEMRASPLRDHDRELVGAVIVLHDVTELDRLATMRRDFVGNVSHELKTPITAIRGMVETMIDDEGMEQATRDRFLARIAQQSVRLSALVSDLLAISRLESREAAIECEPTDLRDAVRSASASLLAGAEERGISVQVEMPDEPVEVNGDALELRQVAMNLLDNALKYTPRDGRVWVRLRTEDGHAVLEVEDTGIGIERSHLDRIFERFYRVDKARSRELGGTGLGLSIVKHVALAHGGEVAVDSTLGKGTVFRVRIPLG